MTLRCLTLLVIALLARVSTADDTPALKSEKEKLSYALGMNLADQLRARSLEVDPDVLSRGFKDSLSGSKTLLSQEEVRAIVDALRKDLKANQASLPTEKNGLRRQLAEKNQKDGDAFLAENKAKDGVVTLESGLQYKVLKTGEGRKPTLDDTVVCHYQGTLINGTLFDSSYRRRGPATFGLRRVIKGWSEALQLMPVGSKWQLFIPSRLAYGERGAGRAIGPNATLIFEVELISIKDRAATQAVEGADPGAPAGSGGPAEPAGTAVPAANGPAPRIVVSFKLDPRIATGNYGGERWVSPPTYTKVGEGKICKIEARLEALDTHGRRLGLSSKWTAADPEMVTITPGEGKQVTMTVQRAGETSVRVTSEGASKELTVKAAYRNNVLQADISQK
jgi:FKBP-type peptidyl-prolyl cis-trans isomerase FklB